jgi:vacuolar-type H+-ATPase subunit I/STV1
MSTGKHITQGMRKKMVWFDMQHFHPQKIAERVGCSRQAVYKHLDAMRKNGDYQRFKKELQGAEPVDFGDERIAPEPDIEDETEQPADVSPVVAAAVGEIAARAAERDRIPREIAKALMYRLRDIDEEIEQRELRIAELKREIDALEHEREVVEAWRNEHDTET